MSDLRAFFNVVPKDPSEVVVADVLAFLHEQRQPRGDGRVVRLSDGEAGLSSRTIKRRLLLFGSLVVFQTLSLPGQFAYMAEESPDLAYLRWPMTAVSVFWVFCIQVVIVSTWKLLTLVKNDCIFSDASLAWVNTIVWAIVAA